MFMQLAKLNPIRRDAMYDSFGLTMERMSNHG